MNIFETAIRVALIVLTACLILGMIRFIKGPTLADRITAFDLLAANVIGIIAIYSVITDDIAFMDAAVILSLIAFLSSMFFAYYMVRRDKQQ
jgi:multicomponent Na+:H+ antiporter subunit F